MLTVSVGDPAVKRQLPFGPPKVLDTEGERTLISTHLSPSLNIEPLWLVLFIKQIKQPSLSENRL